MKGKGGGDVHLEKNPKYSIDISNYDITVVDNKILHPQLVILYAKEVIFIWINGEEDYITRPSDSYWVNDEAQLKEVVDFFINLEG